MTEQEFNDGIHSGELIAQYAIYVHTHHTEGDRIISSGDEFAHALTEMYLFEEFKQTMVTPDSVTLH